ncbi:MAG: BatA domain-containing protein [Deltaproteobacteria bacterium]|nr:BatA domain-containing protein [Deltaproteobacteria bacterium]
MDLLSFARPGFLWGLLGIGLPILIHLLGRRQVRTVPIGTLRFLERAQARAAARWRLRRLLLLLARAAALGCLALLFAGPGCREEGAAAGPATWVLLLDTSPSMAAARGAASCLDRAKEALVAVLDRADPRDRFLLVTTREGDEAPWRRGFTADAAGIRRAVRASEISYGVHRADRALGRALRLLEGTEGGRAVFATDLQASAWGPERVPGAGRVPLRLVDVGLPDAVNVWVERVEEAASGGEAGTVAVRLGTSGTRPGPAARRTVRLRLDDGQAAAAFTSGTEATFRVRPPAGVHAGEVSVEPGGDLALDDRAAFVGRGSGKVRLLLVNGDPRGFEIRDELFFVRRALAPGARLGERFEAREVGAAELSARDFDGVEVALLANPGPVSPAAAARLRERVEAGMGVLVSSGDRWKAGEGAGALAEVLAAPLRDRIAIPPNDPSRKPYEGLDAESLSGPLAPFRDRTAGDLSRVRVWTYWIPEARAPGPLPAQVIGRLDNGAPLLLDRALGRGHTLLLTTTIDRDGADLCLQPAFIPWLERVLLYAAGRLRPRVAPWVAAGAPVAFPYRSEVAVEGPGARRAAWSPGGPAFVPPVPGVYRVREAGSPVDAFAAGIEPAESDLTRLTRAGLDSRLGPESYDAAGGPAGSSRSAAAGRRDLSGRVAAALLAALALEALLSARWPGRRRAGPAEVAP